jgi:HAD superfamily hydrolase (TIGR01509 family)
MADGYLTLHWGMPVTALFFDVGNTLLFPKREIMLLPLHERGAFPTEELLLEIERETKRAFDELQAKDSSVDHGFWHIYYSRLLDRLGMPDELTCKHLVARTRISANWSDIRPGTREALLRLKEKYRLAVISNADGKIAEVLKRCGIADCFETITDSGIVGKEKPHPEIFEAALKSVGVGAEESLYIGDVYSVDYLGATAVGMQGMLFDVAGAYKGNGAARVESLEELESQLRVSI